MSEKNRLKRTGGGSGGRPPRTSASGGEPAGPVRGYTKISQAAKAFGFDFRNKVILDIGSSTGGFTQFALAHGAKRVIAIEKGTNQMQIPLRYDPRIELHEKTDIFEVGSFDVATKSNVRIRIDAPDIVLADVSFISLTKVLEYVIKNISHPRTQFLVMLKPQFEAAPSDLHKGIVKNEKIRRRLIKNFELWLKQNNLLIIKKHDNDLAGKHGNTERFYWLTIAKR